MTEMSVLMLWARMKSGEASAPYPQFVAAFSEGEVDAWPEEYRRRRKKVEDWFRFFGGEDAVDYFFTTWERVERPPFPTREEAMDCV